MTPHPRHNDAARRTSEAGQSLVEFAVVLPLLLLIVLGVVETGYMLLDQHIVSKLSREGSNLISRDSAIQDAVTAIREMSGAPINFDDGTSKVIFSIIKSGGVPGTANYKKAFLYQRHEYGTFPGQSRLSASGGAFSGSPDYRAVNPDTDSRLQIVNCPPTLLSGPGSMAYVTEIFSRHTLITPLDRLGIRLPTSLYSIAYF